MQVMSVRVFMESLSWRRRKPYEAKMTLR
jgi:hypothetical protein